jgi:hypothetical protein
MYGSCYVLVFVNSSPLSFCVENELPELEVHLAKKAARQKEREERWKEIRLGEHQYAPSNHDQSSTSDAVNPAPSVDDVPAEVPTTLKAAGPALLKSEELEGETEGEGEVKDEEEEMVIFDEDGLELSREEVRERHLLKWKEQHPVSEATYDIMHKIKSVSRQATRDDANRR